MSQKKGEFQSKSKKFGAKPGGPSGGKKGGGASGKPGRKPGGKPAGRGGFGKRFEGDRDSRRDDGGYRGQRDGDRGGYKGKKSFGDRKPRREEGEYRPRREEGEYRPRRAEGEYRPRRDDDGYRGQRDGDRGGYKGKKPFGEKKFGDKKFGDKKPRGNGFGKKDYDKKGFDKKRFGDRPRRDDDGYRGARAGFERREYAPASEDTRRKLKSDRPGYGAPSAAFLFGHHAVRAALANPARQVQRLLVTENGFENIREAYDEALAAGLPRPEPVFVEKEDIDRLLPRDAVHQDVLLDAQPPEEVFLQDLLISAAEDAKVIILDQVTDPHNVGAILRSAAAFGAVAVIVQKLHAPDITGTLAKAASGAAEYVPLVREVNLSRAIEQLKEAHFTCIGLDERGKLTMAQAARQAGKGRVAIVMGAEGDGLRRLVAEKCDMLAQLPTEGPIASLNVSNAAAVALYELVREAE